MNRIGEWIKGMDVSTLIEEEACGAEYYDGDHKEELLTILKRYGTNSVRLRLWNHPYSASGDKYGAGTNDLEKTIILARRAKALGMNFLLDFHYSDFWVDPGKQFVPKAWEGQNANELADSVYAYTKEVLCKLKEEDLVPYMVQVGNEITNGCLWPLCNRDYGKPNGYEGNYYNKNLVNVLNSGIRAVKEVSPESIVMLHLDNGGNNELYRSWFDGYFAEGGEDFDVIGLSYYPFWHGNLAALKYNLDDIAVRYGKQLVLAEISMGFSLDDYAAYENMKPEDRKGMATTEKTLAGLDYPMTPEGQKDFMEHVCQILRDVPNGLGMGYYYWEPGWIPVPGCGWATPASLKYIQDKGPCGNEWANQALFDYEGHALPALKV